MENYCVKCGTKFSTDDKFCCECGKKRSKTKDDEILYTKRHSKAVESQLELINKDNITIEEGVNVKKKTGFYCECCLKEANIGHYLTQRGTCVVCGEEQRDGHNVSREDIQTAYQLGEDENGWNWRYCLPAFNVADTDCVCPSCGYTSFSRHNPINRRSDTNIYSCNCCCHPIHTGESSELSHIYTENFAKNSADVSIWINNNKIIVRPGEIYKTNGQSLCLITNGKTCFFINKEYEVVGRMLNIRTMKLSSVAGVSKNVIDYMLFQNYDSECKWSDR